MKIRARLDKQTVLISADIEALNQIPDGWHGITLKDSSKINDSMDY